MMQIADVVQDIFRTLGLDGWETVGMEPADVTIAARSADAGVECPESPGPRGVTRDPPRPAATARIPAEPSAESVIRSHAGEEMSAEAETALASWLVER